LLCTQYFISLKRAHFADATLLPNHYVLKIIF